ncbi:MAG: hypothetical protein ACI86M_002527 [Saprospiraceae bacterium]|jgi:hypothetical protein
MKIQLKNMLLLCFLVCFILNDSDAQIQGTFDLTAAWSFNLETPGINARSYFFLNDKICLGPEFTYFFDKTEVHGNEEITTSAFVIDLNGHYVFEIIEHSLGVYPVMGLNFTREKESIQVLEETEEHTSKAFGFNLGIGAEVPLSKRINLFGEFTHTFSTLEDNVMFLGLNYLWSEPH